MSPNLASSHLDEKTSEQKKVELDTKYGTFFSLLLNLIFLWFDFCKYGDNWNFHLNCSRKNFPGYMLYILFLSRVCTDEENHDLQAFFAKLVQAQPLSGLFNDCFRE